MGLCKLGNDRPGFRRDRDERLPALASAVIRIDNQIFDRRPAAASAKSNLVPAHLPDMGRDPMSVDLKAVPLDASDVAETDDHVAVWQGKLRIGQRAARYDQSDFGCRYCRDSSGQRAESPLADNSTGEDDRERVPPTIASPRCQAFLGTSSRPIMGNTGKASTNRSTIALARISKIPRSRGSTSTRPAIGQKWKYRLATLSNSGVAA